jgi:hypothetical protein
MEEVQVQVQVHNHPRGFQHVYKSKKGNSSLRVQAAHKATMDGAPSSNTSGMKRKRKKAKKLQALQQVLPSSKQSMNKTFLTSLPVFFSGTSARTIANAPLNSRIFSTMADLKVIDTLNGAQMKLENDTVFVLIPRRDAIAKTTHANSTLRSLFALEQAKQSAEKRGKVRVPVAEDNGKYTTVGLKPNRGQTGVRESWPKDFDAENKSQIMKLMKGCEEVAKGYISSDELRGFKNSRNSGKWSQLGTQQIWGSLACGRNYYLNSHTDENFFYSLTTLVSKHGLRAELDRYDLNAEVCSYFVFAEQGIAVALRPGDMLLFNPMYQHCLSSRSSLYMNKDIFSLSLYLKTAVVGKNDNSLPLTKNERDLLK